MNMMWAMALLELGLLVIIVAFVVWAIRKKPAAKDDAGPPNPND
jgi:hypothetical protein